MKFTRLTQAAAVVLCLTVPTMVFAIEKGNVYNIKYDGGSLPDAKAGMDMKLYIDSDKIRVMREKSEVVLNLRLPSPRSATAKTCIAASALP